MLLVSRFEKSTTHKNIYMNLLLEDPCDRVMETERLSKRERKGKGWHHHHVCLPLQQKQRFADAVWCGSLTGDRTKLKHRQVASQVGTHIKRTSTPVDVWRRTWEQNVSWRCDRSYLDVYCMNLWTLWLWWFVMCTAPNFHSTEIINLLSLPSTVY